MKSPFSLQTDRLLLREFQEMDAPGLFELNADHEVMKYAGDPPFGSVKAALAFVQGYDHYQHFGLGRWTVLEKSNDTFLGWCGLKFHSDTGETDLGFRFLGKNWGKGFATEAAKACLHYGFEVKEIPEIIGRAAVQNMASHRVLEKIGMQFVKSIHFDGMEGVQYRIRREDFGKMR